jgi:hypothetical protein
MSLAKYKRENTFREELMKTITTAIFFFIVTVQAWASITCTTPRESKVLVIKKESISLSRPYLDQGNRGVASASSIRTKVKGNGFTKVLFINGDKHTIHVEDKKSFSEVNDYLVIRSRIGHEMTYPLNCQD